MGKRHKVLVFGNDMRIFLAVVRSLGRSGKEVHAAPNDKSPALRSRYITATHWLPRYADNPEAWVTAVKALLEKERFDAVLPNCDDSDLLPFHLHRDEFTAFNIALPNPRSMDLLFDKGSTRQLAAELDVPVAKGKVLSREDDAADIARTFGLPAVVKSRRSVWPDQVGEWHKVGIVETVDELDKVLHGLDKPERFIVESYFPGVGGGVSVLAHQGKILTSFQHRRLREARGGVSSYRISQPVAEPMLQACEKICRATDFTGVCMFEYRLDDESNGWILVETNARFWGSVNLPVSLGVAFPADLCDLMVNGTHPPPRPYLSGRRSRNLVLDGNNLVASFRRAGLAGTPEFGRGLLNFLMHPFLCLAGREASDSFAADDPMPGVFECLMLVPELVRKIASRNRSTNAPTTRASWTKGAHDVVHS
jgi:predicted ATP-grasp superfamily ATP-dependent carboligase